MVVKHGWAAPPPCCCGSLSATGCCLSATPLCPPYRAALPLRPSLLEQFGISEAVSREGCSQPRVALPVGRSTPRLSMVGQLRRPLLWQPFRCGMLSFNSAAPPLCPPYRAALPSRPPLRMLSAVLLKLPYDFRRDNCCLYNRRWGSAAWPFPPAMGFHFSGCV